MGMVLGRVPGLEQTGVSLSGCAVSSAVLIAPVPLQCPESTALELLSGGPASGEPITRPRR